MGLQPPRSAREHGSRQSHCFGFNLLGSCILAGVAEIWSALEDDQNDWREYALLYKSLCSLLLTFLSTMIMPLPAAW